MAFAPPRHCGIYWCCPPSQPYQPPIIKWLPLSSLTAKAHIKHYSAHITLYQTFVVPPVAHNTRSSNQGKIESVKYQFPLYPSSSVTSFLAHITSPNTPTRTIKGIIKPIEKAREIYDTAVAAGQTAALLEQQATDVFLTKLGNIPNVEGTEVKVEIGYVVELGHDSEVDGVKFIVPMSIAPRYGEFTPWNSGADVAKDQVAVANWGNYVSKGITMDVQVSMPGPITGIQSPSHPVSVTMGSHGVAGNSEFDYKKATTKLDLPQETFLGKDFVVHVICKEVAAPRAVLEKYDASAITENSIPNTSALMLTFVPKFVVPPAVQSHPKKPRKELIFLVDRSGSMFDKIHSLRSALTVFIKSLPTNLNLKFDICSFGSSHTFLFHTAKRAQGSQVYNQKTMEMALELAQNVQSDMGGTELAAPIKAICKMAEKREMNRKDDEDSFETEILVLTDGEIWDVEGLSSYVREQTIGWRKGVKQSNGMGKNGVRIFTLGIGDDVSHGLVESLAKAGGGYATVVGGNERFEGKVVRMLKAALGERVGGYQLLWEGMEKWGMKKVDLVIPPPAPPQGSPEDDFEMVDAEEAKQEKSSTAPPIPPLAPPPPPPPITPLAPISLFDQTCDPDAPLDTTHKPMAVTPVPALDPPALIQIPHNIPPLFAFSRSTVYMLLTPPPGTNPPLPEKVTLRGYTASAQPLELTIPVTVLEQPGTTIHQLAVKKYLDDLREGETWIHDAQRKRTKLKCAITSDNGEKSEDFIQLPLTDPGFDFGGEAGKKFDEFIRVEGERVGVGYGVVGKWTSFVAVEETAVEDGNKAVESKEAFVVDITGKESPPRAMGSMRQQLLGASIQPPPPQYQPQPQSSTGLVARGYSMPGGAAGMAKRMARSGLGSGLGTGSARQTLGSGSQFAQQGQQQSQLQQSRGQPPMASRLFGGRALGAAPPPLSGNDSLFSTGPPEFSSATTAVHFGGSVAPPHIFARSSNAAAPPAPPLARARATTDRSRDYEKDFFDCECVTSDGDEDEEEEAVGSSAILVAATTATSPLPKAEQTTTLIGLQKFAGNWEMSPALVSFMRIHLPQVDEGVIKGEGDDLWATVLVLLYLEMRLGGEEEMEMWELVGEKGWEWVRGEVGGDERKIEERKKAAMESVFEGIS